MFRNQYDTDVTVWSPQGHLHQIDYAMEAVKQGSACLGLTSNKFAVLCGIKRQSLELAEHQKKVFKIDEHMGIAISGLTADARTLARFMRTESLNHKFVYGSSITVGRLVSDVADKKQECTQSYIRRPYGVGLLVAGVDVLGKDELIHHALQGVRGCLQGDQELTASNVTIAVVGVDQPFKIIEGAELQPYSRDFKMEAKASTDERFYTPRSSAQRGYSSAGSEDERFVDRTYHCHASRAGNGNPAAMPSAITYKDAAFRASSKRLPVTEPAYDSFDYKQHHSGSTSELRGAAPPADDYDLFSAARHNHYDSVIYMLDQGVPVNSRDAFGNTLLSIACQNGLKRITKLALRRGANINSQNITSWRRTSDMVCERLVASPRERPDDPMDGRSRTASDDSDLEEEMMRVNVFDYEWRRQMHVGDQVDAQNVFGNWCPARVLQIADGEVLLQFLNMHESWHQWLQLDSGRLAQPGTKARNDSVPIRQAQHIEVRPGGGNSSLWKEALAVRAGGGSVLVRYAGRDQKYDEWIQFTPAKVAPAGEHLQLRGRGSMLEQRKMAVDVPNMTHRRVIQAQNPRFTHYRDSLQATLGLRIYDIEGDGNCLFRSVSHQVYGDDSHHALVRAACMDYMESEKEYFEPYVVGDMAAFMRYLSYKRRDGVWGDDPELQALCELYDRPAEVFAYDPQQGFRKLRASTRTAPSLALDLPFGTLSYYGGGHYDSLVGTDHQSNLIREDPGQWEQRHIGYSHRINSRETRSDVSGVEQEVQTQSDRERTEVEQLEQVLMQSRNEFDAMDRSLEDTLKLSLAEHGGEASPAQAHREREEIEEATRESEMAAIQAELLAKAKAESEEEQMKSAIQASLGGHAVDFDAQMSAAIQASLGDAGASVPATSGADDYDEQLRRAMELSAQEYAPPPQELGLFSDESTNTDEMDELQRAIQASLERS
ncbi:Nucleophile aminohydrolase [Phytophthora cactorum]|nr:Nucleophile aminohydrolase [Phytophthora cactorum]